MKKIIPNLSVDNCKEALDYYKDVFSGEIKNVKLADGIEMFKGHEGKIIHGELHMNDDCIMYLSDVFGEKKPESNIELIIELESKDEIERIYSALRKNATVKFELQKTFWGAYHAVLTDFFGITWGLNYCETIRPQPTVV